MEYFSDEYIKEVERYTPFTIEYCINLKENIKNKLKKEYYGVSLEDILLYFVEER